MKKEKKRRKGNITKILWSLFFENIFLYLHIRVKSDMKSEDII